MRLLAGRTTQQQNRSPAFEISLVIKNTALLLVDAGAGSVRGQQDDENSGQFEHHLQK